MYQKWFSLLLLFLFFGCAPMAARVALPQSTVPYDRAWQVALNTSLNYYERIAVEDKEGGFFQTAWNIEKSGLNIGIPVRRNRLIGHVASKSPFRLHLTLEVEAFSMELGRWVKETNHPLLAQISQDMSAKLQF
ncbi:MAG: hypothetical protein LLH30_04360 [Candidatus Manganitrophus sp. SA1]|nr:hypothetical protein [Candidatus Manganitrophus morganii]